MFRTVTALLLLILTAGTAAAQETRIAAVVNDDVISINDLEARIKLVLLSSQLPDNPQVRQRVTPQVLRSLIDERLELQEAKRFNVAVSDEDVNRAFERLERQNNMPKGGLDQLLTQRGIPRSTLVNQITATLAWSKLVEGRLAPNVTVSDEEINEAMARIKDSIGKPQSRVGEIFLAVDNPTQEPEVKALADRLVEQIRNGANFAAVAQQFSQSATAAVGGDLGWVLPDELPPEVEQTVARMQPGQLAPPIRGPGGFYLVYLADRRTLGKPSPNDAVITLTRVAFPLPLNATEAERQKALVAAQQVTDTAKSCGEMLKIGQQVSPQISGELRDVKIGSLPAELRPTIEALKIAEPSKPLVLKDGVGVLMVCERKDPPSPIATREQVQDSLMRQRLDTLARRYLRDLRRAAYVDMRV
ncbi:MAG TPA: peptidylprolyl isomerase [Stellaceae bacterium]|nr:peptidylprolyl isomerase [Stellaceae bacterium]